MNCNSSLLSEKSNSLESLSSDLATLVVNGPPNSCRASRRLSLDLEDDFFLWVELVFILLLVIMAENHIRRAPFPRMLREDLKPRLWQTSLRGDCSKSSYGALRSKCCISHTSDFSSLTLATISFPSGLRPASYLPSPGNVATAITSLGMAT